MPSPQHWEGPGHSCYSPRPRAVSKTALAPSQRPTPPSSKDELWDGSQGLLSEAVGWRVGVCD